MNQWFIYNFRGETCRTNAADQSAKKGRKWRDAERCSFYLHQYQSVFTAAMGRRLKIIPILEKRKQ